MTLQTHLTSGQTTVCYAWIIRRLDSVVIGFTDHDEDVTVNSVQCHGSVGITTTKFARSLGMEADDLEVDGVLDDDLLSADDIRAGLYDNATAEIYLVNWQNPGEFELMSVGSFGNITETDTGLFKTEFRSRTEFLEQVEGRVYQRTCDAKLGDARCGVDLDVPAFSKVAEVVSLSGATLVVDDLSAYATEWFSLGKIITDEGYELKVRYHAGNTLRLWEAPNFPMSIGDNVTIRAGCKQDSATCRTKFNNIVNFRGQNLMPGNDRMIDYPVRGQGNYEGGSLFK